MEARPSACQKCDFSALPLSFFVKKLQIFAHACCRLGTSVGACRRSVRLTPQQAALRADAIVYAVAHDEFMNEGWSLAERLSRLEQPVVLQQLKVVLDSLGKSALVNRRRPSSAWRRLLDVDDDGVLFHPTIAVMARSLLQE